MEYKNLECVNQEKTKPTIEYLSLAKGDRLDAHSLEDKVVFILEGEISVSFAFHIDRIIDSSHLLYLPADYNYCIQVLSEKASILIMRIHDHIQFCGCLRIEELDSILKQRERYIKSDSYSLYLLDIKPILKVFLETLLVSINQEIPCKYYYQHKVKEFLLLLKLSYPKAELAYFFYRALSSDLVFSSFLIKNAHKYKTRKELAQDLNYTLSGFDKKFRKVFKEPPYHWILKKKAEKIYTELVITDKPLKLISSDFGFSTTAHFSSFCRKYLGDTPMHIRSKSGNT